MNRAALTSIRSPAARTIVNFPATARPPKTALIALPLVMVARMTLAPPKLDQFRRWIVRATMDVPRCAELSRQGLLIHPSGDDNGLEAQHRGSRFGWPTPAQCADLEQAT
jgi:hypothetical protein